jgi:hypothetical protein
MNFSSELRKWKSKVSKAVDKALGWLDKLDDVLEPAAGVLAAAGLPQYAAIVTLIVDSIHKAEKIGDVAGLVGEQKLDVAAGVLLGKVPDLTEDVAAEKPLAKKAIQLVIDEAAKLLKKAT